MQNVAREMNLSETAFLLKRDDGGYDLRWFTPVYEVDLCGHATLASAHLLWETGALEKNETARFHTLSGLLTATLDGDWIGLDFPSEPANETAPPPGLIEALGIKPLFTGQNRMDYLLEADSAKTLRTMTPDFSLLAKCKTRGVIVTSRSDSVEYDFISRFFAPSAGIDEDPVTGSAHCCLGPYWSERLGKTELTAYQASARGGVVKVRFNGPRTILSGQAVTVLRAEWIATS